MKIRDVKRTKSAITTPVLLLLGLLVTVVSPAAAQTSLERLEVAFWPEYDRPSMLVLLRAHLPADAQLPTQVTLPMPHAAGVPNAVAKRGPQGGLLQAQHSFDTTDDFTLVQIVADTREVRLEYYQPLEMTGENRRFLFEWPGLVSVDRMDFEVMQPLHVSTFAVTPPGSTSLGADGLTYHRGDLGAMPAGTTTAIEILYAKSSSTLTASGLQQTAPPPAPIELPPATAPDPVAAEPAAPSTWPVVVGVLAIGFIGGYFVARSGKKKSGG